MRGHDGRSAIEFYDVATGSRKALTMIDKTFSWACALARRPIAGPPAC
jgi:hypothetical protein